MKVIVDTNIIVSAVLRDRDPELVIQFIVDHPEFEWIASQAILSEYKEVLNRPKFRLTQAAKDDWFNLLDIALSTVEVNISVDFPADPDDAMLLACAISSNADFLLTGDTELLKSDLLPNTTVLTVAMFKALFCDV